MTDQQTVDLTDLVDTFSTSLGVTSVSEIGDALARAVSSNDTAALVRLRDAHPTLTEDWLQRIWQYYLADRDGKKQDFTPPSLAKLVTALAGEASTVLDMCSGTGALTVAYHSQHPEARFLCQEVDESVIPWLLCNLAIRKINAVVQQADVLTGELGKIWTVKNVSGEVSMIAEGGRPFDCQVALSNPPFNMRWKWPDLAPMWPQYAGRTVPPEANANHAFTLTAMEKVRRGVFIFPNSISNSKNEAQIRRELLHSNWIDAVIACPDRMFEATAIPVTVLVLDAERETRTVSLVDAVDIATEEVRQQRGQYGKASHTSRVYEKRVNTFTDGQISSIVCAARGDDTDFSTRITADDLDEACNLSPALHVDRPYIPPEHRPIEEIVEDINACQREQNLVRLVVNASTARMLRMEETLQLQERGAEIMQNMEDALRPAFQGLTFEKPAFIRVTKRKNEFSFENTSKDELSTILMTVAQMWKANIQRINNAQNLYLAELRDALLPDLMSGKLMLEPATGEAS